MESRREFLRILGAGGAAMIAYPATRRALLPNLSPMLVPDASPDPWEEVPTILGRIKAPAFPDRDFDISAFDAVGDNGADNTAAFQKAIAACHAAGGGRVVVPPGQYISGAIELKSNVNLHVRRGATIRFSRDTWKYPLVFTRWEGMELMNFSPFLYAFEQENVAITGQGTIDGNCDCEHWWPWKGRLNCGWKKGDAPI